MKKMTGVIAVTLVVSVLCSGNSLITAKTEKKTGIMTKKVTMNTGQKKSIKLKNKKKKAKYLFQSSKTKIVKVSKKGVMTAVKAGKAKVTVKERLGKKTKKIGTVSVTVKKAGRPAPSPDQKVTPAPVSTPTATPANEKPTVSPLAPTPEPGQTEPPQTPTPKPPVNPEIKDTPAKLDSTQSGVKYGKVVKRQYYSSITEKNRNVNVILPDGYTEEKKYPVIYLFHGGMGDENDWINGKVQNMVGNMIASGEAKEMIVVMPNCRCRENDAANPTDGFAPEHVHSFDKFLEDFRDNLMPYIESTYSVATGRDNTAIAGLSMGGRVALNIGISLPEQVGYIGAFSPAYGIFPYTNNGLTEEGLFTEETFTLPDHYKNSTYLLINNGNQDGMVKEEPQRYHNALEANGVHHTFYTLDGGHDWVVWKNGFYNFARYLF